MRVGLEAAAAFALLASGCGLGRSVHTVDRVEDGRAVLLDEQGQTVVVRASELPQAPHEGDVLVDFKTDEKERERLLFDLRERRNRLLQRSGGTSGDFSLEGP
ncbi:MAG: DUF3006 domain-containing protein [Myxococcales bacterium]